MPETDQTVFTNKMVVRFNGGSHDVFSRDGIDHLYEYDLVSCDVDPALKELTYQVAYIPPGCFNEGVAELIANTPRQWTKQVDDPTVRIDDDVIRLMKSRGVEVKRIFDD